MSFWKKKIFFIFNQNFKNQMKMSDEQSKIIINKKSDLQAGYFKNSETWLINLL